jgi:hypothetical protein
MAGSIFGRDPPFLRYRFGSSSERRNFEMENLFVDLNRFQKLFNQRREKELGWKKTFDRNVGRRAARFFLVHDTKNGKNVPNEHKIYQMVI